MAAKSDQSRIKSLEFLIKSVGSRRVNTRNLDQYDSIISTLKIVELDEKYILKIRIDDEIISEETEKKDFIFYATKTPLAYIGDPAVINYNNALKILETLFSGTEISFNSEKKIKYGIAIHFYDLIGVIIFLNIVCANINIGPLLISAKVILLSGVFFSIFTQYKKSPTRLLLIALTIPGVIFSGKIGSGHYHVTTLIILFVFCIFKFQELVFKNRNLLILYLVMGVLNLLFVSLKDGQVTVNRESVLCLVITLFLLSTILRIYRSESWATAIFFTQLFAIFTFMIFRFYNNSRLILLLPVLVLLCANVFQNGNKMTGLEPYIPVGLLL